MTHSLSLKLGDVIEFVNGDRGSNYPSDDEQLAEGYCLFLGTRNVRDGHFDFRNTSYISSEIHDRLNNGTLRRGDIVVTIRGTLGNTAVYDESIPYEPTRINSAMAILRPTSAYDPHFIKQFVRAALSHDWLESNKRGTAQPHLRADDLLQLPVPILSKRQQRLIVTKIDALMAPSKRARADLDRVKALVARAKLAVLAECFGVPEEVASLGDFVSNALIGLVRSKVEQKQRGTPYIRMQHFDLDGAWNTQDLTYVACSSAEALRYGLIEDDLLFNTRNSLELVGKVALCGREHAGFVYNNNLLRLRFRDDVLAGFAYRQMQAPPFRAHLRQQKSATTSVAALYQGNLMRTPFWVPALAEQKQIAKRINVTFSMLDRAAAEAQSASTLLDRLDQSILAKALRGELVPQDPDDEPTSVLLGRIHAERNGPDAPKRRGRGARVSR